MTAAPTSQASIAALLADRLRTAADDGQDMPLPEFCEKRLWVRDQAGELVKFITRPIQREYLGRKAQAKATGAPLKFLLLKYRRGGFSTLEQAASYKMAVTKNRSQVATIAHTKESTQKISGIAKLFREMDPRLRDQRDDGRVSLSFEHTRSTFTLGTAGGTAFGRGDTLQRVHGSEVAYWCQGPDQIDRVDSLVAGLTEACGCGPGKPGEVVLESTPNGVEWFCTTFREARRGLNDWTPIFLPWFADRTNRADPGTYDPEEILDTMTDEEKNLARRQGLDEAQIAWRRSKQKALGRLFRQEYPEDPDTCFLTSGTPFFDVELCIRLLESMDKDIIRPLQDQRLWKQEKIPGGQMVQAEPPEDGKQYVIGADTSEGLPKSDPCGCMVLEKESGRQVAWVYGRFRPEVLGRLCVDMAARYNNALLGVERENHGHSVLNTIQNFFGYKNLFYMKNERGEPGPGKDGRVGWTTNSETRPIMLDDLELALRDGALKPRMREFVSECLTFKLQKNGKYEADPGTHDDAVMMTAIAWQMRKFSRHKARVIILD